MSIVRALNRLQHICHYLYDLLYCDLNFSLIKFKRSFERGCDMAETRYVCSGSCGAELSRQEYEAGQITCGDPTCDSYGEPLEKIMYCPSCDEYYTREEEHAGCD